MLRQHLSHAHACDNSDVATRLCFAGCAMHRVPGYFIAVAHDNERNLFFTVRMQ